MVKREWLMVNCAGMDLTQPLKDLVANVPGALGAVLIDNEGDAVTYFCAQDETARIRLISAYHRIWLSDCLTLARQLQLGELAHLIQCYEYGTVLVKALNGNHAIVLIAEIDLYVGQGLFHLDRIGNLINEDL